MSDRRRMRIVLGVVLAAATLTVLIVRNLEDPDLQTAIASAVAADDRLIGVALEQYPRQAPPIVVTYGQLPLFREQLARFGPQVVPIVAAYQESFTTADALQRAQEAWQSFRDKVASWFTLVGPPAVDAPAIDAGALDRLSPEARGLIALLNMRDEGNAFVGQWEITAAGDANWVPSRGVILGGTELLTPGLTALERRIVQDQEVDWSTYAEAAVDVAAIASGATLLRFARTAGRGVRAARVDAGTATLGSRPLAAAAKVLGINAVRYGVPIGVVVLVVLHPGVFTQYLWLFAENLGIPGIIGPIIGWGILIVPLAFLLSWILLSVRMLRAAGRLLAGAARGCRRLAVRSAVPDRR